MNVLAGILGVLALAIGIGLVWLAVRAEARRVRDIEREEMEEAYERALASHHFRSQVCALRGHQYRLQVDGWLCPACGDHVPTSDEGGVA